MTAAERLVDELGRLFAALSRGAHDGLTTTQRLAQLELTRADGVRLTALALRIGASDPTTSRAVDALVAAGFVERRPDPDDRRAQRLLSTRSGRAHIERRRAEVSQLLSGALAGLPAAERAHLISLLAKLNAGLDGPAADLQFAAR